MTESICYNDSRILSSPLRAWNLAFVCAWISFHISDGFLIVPDSRATLPALARRHDLLNGASPTKSTLSMIYAPPGSGYSRVEDEESELPDSYIPMMEYPGTMRPGRTPENMPFHDLPIADSDPDPVPWPHFQEIEWHHRWDPPHPHPIPMEE